MATEHPALASSSATPRPRPRLEPVTRTTGGAGEPQASDMGAMIAAGLAAGQARGPPGGFRQQTGRHASAAPESGVSAITLNKQAPAGDGASVPRRGRLFAAAAAVV